MSNIFTPERKSRPLSQCLGPRNYDFKSLAPQNVDDFEDNLMGNHEHQSYPRPKKFVNMNIDGNTTKCSSFVFDIFKSNNMS